MKREGKNSKGNILEVGEVCKAIFSDLFLGCIISGRNNSTKHRLKNRDLAFMAYMFMTYNTLC